MTSSWAGGDPGVPASDLRFQAVIFDLFGTLAPFSFAAWDVFLADLAASLGVPATAYALRMGERYYRLESGELTVEQVVADSAVECGVQPPAEAVDAAVAAWGTFQATQLEPYDEALEVLPALKQAGVPLALISNAPPPVHELWQRSRLAPWFQVAVFSNLAGCRKPDARIYLTAGAQLGVHLDRCLFVGDGSSGELQGARALGMVALLIRRPDDPPENDVRYNRHAWDGPVISSLRELPGYLELPAC